MSITGKGKIIVIAILMMIISFFAFTGKAYAAWQVKSPYNNTEVYYTNIHLYVDGEEIEPDDSNAYKKFISLYPASNNVTGGTLPDSKVDQEPGDYGTDWETGQYQIITNKAGDRGVIEWYDNPEFNGEPISTFLFKDYPDGSSFYAKTGPLVTTYINGEERKLVVGRTYSPRRIYDDYYLVKNVFIDKNNQKNIIESDFNDPEHNMFSSNIRSGAKENEYHYFADLTEPLKEGLNAKTPTKVTHYYNYFLPFANLNDCSKDEDGRTTCGIADPNTGETITNGIGLFNSTKYIPFSSVLDLPSYYQILGFVDQYGNNYDERFLVTEDFDGKSLTSIIDSKQTCTASSISTPMAEFGIGSLYNSTIAYNGSYLNVDFDERYFTKKDHWAQLSEYYDDGKVYRSVSTCLPYDVELTSDYYENPKINFDLLVVLQDTNGEKVTKNSTYTLPNEGVPKASEVFTYTLKYQDGVTPDGNITYTKVYTPNGFKIDGVHYDFGESIIVTRNLYIEYDYDVEIIQDELPTPTRNNYTFKGWFDMPQGGHIVNDLTESNSNILYAQWADKDKVTIIRPDGIATELEKGSEYTIPDIPFKDESLVARVSFVYNDNSGKVDYSSITKTYQKNGVTIKETGTHYNVGDKIIVNENMTLIPDYIETIKPAKFPSDPERNDYTFLGWYDKLPNGTKYTEYSGDKDLTLYAKWHSNLPEEYTLPEVPSKDDEIVSTVTFKYNNGNEDTTSNVIMEYIPNGYIDNATGNTYEVGDKVTIKDNTDIVPRYIETIIPSEFPSDPTKENYIFQGWYDSNTGGNKYTSYSDINDITLYAHWNSEGGVTPSDDILCKRYGDITHDKTELETGDDFVCDVNGDGLFSEDDEMFYYVSDYYDTTLKEFNSNYAALIYSYSVLSGEIRIFEDGDGNASYNIYQNPAYNGPSGAIRELPTSSEWSNTSLYKTTRSILSVSGENTLNGNTLNSAFSYDGYSSRLLTAQELARGCDIDVTDDNASIPNKCSFLTININNQIEPGNTGHNYFLENPTGQDEAAMINMGQYRQHNDYFEAMTVRPVIDVPKTRMELGETNTFVITYPDGSTEEVEEGSTFTFPNVPSKENEVISTVTFKYNNGEEDTTSDVLREFIPNNWTVNSTNYNPGDTLTVTSNITLQANYVETVVGATFPSNPTKENNTFQGWYDSETYGSEVSSYNGNEDITLYAHWINGNDGEYNLGVNDIPKESEIISTVTFKYHNGDSDTTSNVIKSYVPNGWLVDGVHYSNNSAVEKTTSTVIEPDYKEIIHDATFPNNPTKDGYEFVGWFTEETGGEQVTFLNSDSDISIHAQYTDSYALLDTGPNINPIIFNMMSSVSADYKRFVFRKATQTEYESISDSLTNDNIISLSSSPHEVYLWVEQKDDPVSTANYVLLYYSDADIIFMNSDSSSLFENLYSNGKLEIHLSDLNFSKVTNMSKMFMKAGLSILDIDNINTSNVTDMSHMFEQYESYSSTFDLSSLNTSRVTNMSSMFRRNTYLETLDLSNFDTSNVTDMSKMFSTNSLYLKNLDVSNFDTSNVTDMSYMFAYSTYLETLDVSNFDTHNVTNMSNMFASLGKIEELDVSNFDTHNVTDMSNMFANLTIIEELDLSNFDTSNVTNMKEMFYYMTHLTSLNVSNFDTHNVTDMSYMFSNVSSMISYDLSSFDTSNVTTTLRMFENNSSLTSLDLSSFDTSSLTSLREMFANSSSLRTIYVSNLWNLRNDANGYQMFDGDTSLVGQKGTRYKSTNSNSQTYAHVDEGTSNPGYLTYKGKRYITYPDGTIDEVDNNSSYTFRINTSTKENDILSTATFIFDNGREDYTSNVTKSYIASGWKYNDTHIDDEETMTITEDIVLDYDYIETIIPCEFPIEPTKAYHTFNGWYNEDTKYTSYDGDEDITLTAKWTKKVNITYPDGTTEKVDSGTIITLDNGTDKEEKYYNITFKYNYENSPSDKVVRISSYDKFIGWLVNDTLYNSGDEIEVTEDITITPKYETIISNNNLPKDPEREGYDFLGWYDGNDIESSNKIDITKVNKQMTLYAGWKVTGEYIVFFDNKKYTFNDGESVNTFDLGYAYNEKNDNYEIVIDYQDNETPIRIVPITITNTFVNWTDENNNEYSEIINLNTDLDGMHFTSHYNQGEFDEIDLSTYYPDTADFAGFYTDRNNGDLVTSITTPQNINLYAHYDENKIAIITLDNEIEVYSIGDTYTLPSDNTKEDDIVVITFDPQNGDEVFTRNITTSYTFEGYRLDIDNTLYEGEHSFTVEGNMTFNSKFSSNTTGDTWPSNPSKDNYIFLGWYTNQTSGEEVFNFDGITSNTSLYAHYTTNDESFVTLTNTVTGESLKVQKNTDWLFNESKFNKDKKEKLGTITYKFNSTGYPDEEIDYYRTSTPTGYYINGDTNNLIDLDDAHQFNSDSNITPYYGNVVTDSHVGTDQFDYEITNGDKVMKCFSKTNQTDPHDDEEYTCYENYDENDGDVTVYLHWKEIKDINITLPDGTIEVHKEGEEYSLGTNNISKDNKEYSVTFDYQDDRENTTDTYKEIYTPNGWLINNVHYDNEEVITLSEDIVIEADYTISNELITLPEPTGEHKEFVEWNSTSVGDGITYDNDSINNLNKDTTVYAIWINEDVNITFVENGGTEVSDITIEYNTSIGELPTTSKENERITEGDNNVIVGYIFDGWYRDSELTSKISSTTKFTEDTTLYAKWVEDRFPYVYPYHEEDFVCTGSNYIDTGVMLYTNQNNDYLKDYEVGFTIKSYNPSEQEKQAVFFNAKWENESSGWPGLVFRRYTTTNNLELTQRINRVNASKQFNNWTLPYEVKIYRINKIIYYSVDGGETKTIFQNTDGFNQFIDTHSFFCAGDNGSGGAQRFLKGTISDYYIKMGEYQGTATKDTTHTVTYPDGSIEVYGHNTIIDLDENERAKESEDVATVIFKYHNGEEDTTSKVVKNYTPDGFIANGTVHYDNNSTLVVDEDKVLTYDYSIENTDAEFPSDPVKEHYTFTGWFDQETGGNEYTEYNGENDLILHAQYTQNTVTITTPDGPIEVPEGEDYELPTNDENKDTENVGTVTFKLHNEEDDIVRYVTKTYTKNGWLINGVHYDDKEIINPIEDIELVPDYIEAVIPVEFPSDPEKDNYEFIGWFDQETDGTKYIEYDSEEDITLHAQYEITLPTDITIDSEDVIIIVGETHQIGVTFIPEGSHDTLTYNDFDKDIISLTEEGLITGLTPGETTITIGTENTDIEKTINVIVLDNKITSKVLSVEDRNLGRIIIGENPETSINDFLDKIDNPKEYLVVYDKDGNQIDKDEFDSTIVTTGMKVKLVIDGTEYDEVIAIIRGDIDQDGYVDISDSVTQLNHILYIELIDDYRLYAADIDIDEEAEEDEMIDISDNVKLDKFILGEIDNINE